MSWGEERSFGWAQGRRKVVAFVNVVQVPYKRLPLRRPVLYVVFNVGICLHQEFKLNKCA